MEDKLENLIKILDELAKLQNDAYKSGHFLQCAVIVFQVTELLFRVHISILIEKKKLLGWIQNKIDDERSLFKLAFYAYLMEPNNGISIRMKNFNERRNSIMHRILDFESVESLNEELKDFCDEGKELIGILSKLSLEKPISEGVKGSEP